MYCNINAEMAQYKNYNAAWLYLAIVEENLPKLGFQLLKV